MYVSGIITYLRVYRNCIGSVTVQERVRKQFSDKCKTAFKCKCHVFFSI